MAAEKEAAREIKALLLSNTSSNCKKQINTESKGTKNVENEHIKLVGSRVVRGPAWKWDKQDGIK